MITGHGELDLAIQSIQHDAVDFVTKPIRDQVLEIALKRARDKIRMRRKLAAYTEHLEQLVEEKSARVIELERRAAVGQTLESLIAAFRGIAGGLGGEVSFFNDMPCYVSVHTPAFNIVAANQKFRDRIGDVSGRKSWDIYDVDISPRPSPVEKTVATGIGQEGRHTIRLKDGAPTPVMVHTAPIHNQNGQVELVLEISADITEIEQLQTNLRATQQRFRQLFDEVPCYITVQDRDLRITAANRRFKADFGEEAGAFCYERYKHRSDACPRCPVLRTFEDGLSHSQEAVMRTQSGEEYHMLVITSPIRDAGGEVTQVMEMSTNITEVRRLQDHLTSLGLLIGSASHGIKGLLTGLDGGMYLVDSGIAKDDALQVKEGWETVRLMVERIRNMMVDILFYAREKDLKWQRVDIASFARETADSVEGEMAAAGIELVREIATDLSEVRLDVGVVRAALLNILENALYACKTDPASKAHRVVFRAFQESEMLVFSVEDNGTGMDETTRSRLFKTVLSSKGRKGTGLGLFISSKIIEQNGGTLTAVSTLGEGSTFTIKIPKSPRLHTASGESPKRGPGDGIFES
jgi:PAS domain S-box-containing protein